MNDRFWLVRKVLGLTITEIANKIGVRHQAINLWEKNINPFPPARQKEICDLYGINLSWLATGEGEMLNKPLTEEQQQRLDFLLNRGDSMNGRLQLLREKLGLSRAKFASRLDVRSGLISAWESGEQQIDEPFLRIICDEFGANKEWLVSGQGDMFVLSTKRGTTVNIEAVAEIVIKCFDALPPKVQEATLEVIRRVLEARKDADK